jgi:hypothetical protein
VQEALKLQSLRQVTTGFIMMHCNMGRSLLTVAAAAVLIGSTVSAAAADGKTRLPFQAGAVITEYLGSPTQECYVKAPPGGSAYTGSISGSGLGSPIGLFSVQAQDCITSSSPPPLPLLGLKFSSQNVVLTTVNGQLFVQYSGTAEMQPGGLLILSGEFTITGGTGRFEGAKGSGTLEGTENAITTPAAGPAAGIISLSGEINY